jgi:KEOPS complex subunit Pcc1
MKANAVLRLKFPSQRHLEIIFKALLPEVRKPPTMRSRVFLERDDTFLILKIEAKDTVALRASVNAYLRWINSMTNALEVLQNIS